MIVAGTHPPINSDPDKNQPSMTLRYWDGDNRFDYKVDGKVVKSLVDIDALLIMMWQVCEYGVLPGKICVDSNCHVLPH